MVFYRFISQRRTTITVDDAVDAEGNAARVVGSSEVRLRPAQRAMLQAGEVEARGPGHAEVAVLDHVKTNNLNVRSIGASRPICSNCAVNISSFGIAPSMDKPHQIDPVRPISK